MTLYLKYRPKSIEELDNENVRESLQKLVKTKELPHAFLFSGPKGTGKTSAARIIAKIANCERIKYKNGQIVGEAKPCNKCQHCVSVEHGNNLDVIEMDAASHRGIDDIRVLREAVKLAPVDSRKKIYIIDEAHMLTLEASNALLKTLEEPPAHVIFILATTNPEKIIDTIKSRTITIQFNKASGDEIVHALKRVVKGEKIKLDQKILQMIAQASAGSFRDAIKLFEQLILEEKIKDPQKAEEYLFKRSSFNIEQFINFLAAKDEKAAITAIEEAYTNGSRMEEVNRSVIDKLKLMLVEKSINQQVTGISEIQTVALLELFLEAFNRMRYSPIDQLPLEIAIVKWCEATELSPQTGSGATGDESATKKLDSTKDKIAADVSLGAKTISKNNLKEISDDIWKQILAAIRPINASVEALLRAARPIGFDGKNLSLAVYYRFHKERLEDVKQRQILENVVEEILGVPVKVYCELTEPPLKVEPKTDVDEEVVLTEKKDDDIIKLAEEIFSN